jgi:hypothetical protein
LDILVPEKVRAHGRAPDFDQAGHVDDRDHLVTFDGRDQGGRVAHVALDEFAPGAGFGETVT